jgi:pathogenesis-related protein 1
VFALKHAHLDDGAQGQNLYAMGSTDPSPQPVSSVAVTGTQAWLAEESIYDKGPPGFGEQTGHYTQVVWKASTSLGCAVHTTPKPVPAAGTTQPYTWTVLACNYSPAGNVDGEFASQVSK